MHQNGVQARRSIVRRNGSFLWIGRRLQQNAEKISEDLSWEPEDENDPELFEAESEEAEA
jgi:hypothetical protein